MARPSPKISKTLAKAMYQHRIDPIKHPAAMIMKKNEIPDHNKFYRLFYQAAMQQA
jgi:hypothetical protein